LLIKEAEEIADSIVDVVPSSHDDGVSRANWTIIFSAAMNKLSKPLLNGSNGASGSSRQDVKSESN
jgi:hypothetical protein